MSSDHPGDFEFNLNDPDDPLRKEEREIKATLAELMKKISGTSIKPIKNVDILKYLRVINFNFAALSKLIHAIHFRQNVAEDILVEIHKMMSEFVEANRLLEDALDNNDNSTKNG